MLVAWIVTRAFFVFLQESPRLLLTGIVSWGMFDDAAKALEEIEPEDKTRNEVLYAQVDIYLAAKKW